MKLAWSILAKQELRELRRYSVERWGAGVAKRYLEDVRDTAKRVAFDPRRAKVLAGSLGIARVRSHYLVVQINTDADRLTVARVLHTSMDVERHLPGEVTSGR